MSSRLAAYAVARDAGGRVLLVRIAPGYPAAGKWTLPGGGVRFREHPEAAVIRELEEETGLLGVEPKLAFVHSAASAGDDEAWHAVRIVYGVQVVGGELRDEKDESTDAAAWFSLEEARDLPTVDVAGAALDWIAGDDAN